MLTHVSYRSLIDITMKKLFIVVYDSANTGKTTSLNATRSLIASLAIKKGAPYIYELLWGEHGGDFRCRITTDAKTIGISSAGDDATAVKEGLDMLESNQKSCDIIILATRSKGCSTTTVDDFRSQLPQDSDIVWLTKEHLADIVGVWTDDTRHVITNLMAQHTAESIVEIIRLLRPGII